MNDKWVIIASGPSMARIDMEVVRASGWRVMTINNSWELAPWADAMYAGDLQWWERYGDSVRFAGEKWTRDEHAAIRYQLHHIERESGAGLCQRRGRIHSGGNSGYQAINLAWHFGARRFALLGFDMHRKDGGHWHGEHEGMLSAPASHIVAWRQELSLLAHDLRHLGCQVVNATPGTALTCFPCAPLNEALRP